MGNLNYHNMRFLIVDNIKPSQEILKQFAMRLTRKQVDSTHHAQDVPTICQQVDYDIILLGYDLGDNQKNGQQILEELRTNDFISRHCIVILITAEVSQSMVLAALEHKPDHYLCKPYSLSELQKRLNGCLHKKLAMSTIYRALDYEQPERVIQYCNDALIDNTPYKTECLGIKSRQLFELKKLEEAKAIYKLYKNSPSCQWANIGLGKIALYDKEFVLAESIFKHLIKKHPLYLSSYDWLAITYQEQLHYLFAENTLEQALTLSPRSLKRLKKFAKLCVHNEHFDKAALAYENTYRLAKNSIHYSSDNAINYTQAYIDTIPSIEQSDLKKINAKLIKILKQNAKDFKGIEVRVHSHLLNACLLRFTEDHTLANEELLKGEKLLTSELESIPENKLYILSKTLQKVTQTGLSTQIELPTFTIPESEKLTNNLSETLFHSKANNKIKGKAQKALEHGLELYGQKRYTLAVKALEDALNLYPDHLGIKLNLTQALLQSYDEQKKGLEILARIKGLLIDISLTDIINDDDTNRLKKMQKKYQLIAGI